MVDGPAIGPRRNDERAYERALRRTVLDPLVTRTNSAIALAADEYEQIRQAIRGVGLTAAEVQAAEAAAEQAMISVTTWHKRRFARAMRRHLGIRVDLISDTPLDLAARVAENVALIRTIEPRYHQSLADDLTRLQSDGPFDQAKLRQTLRQRYRSTGYNLRRLTRDQTSKLVGQLNQARQTEVGVSRYRWRTAEDQRVRPSHRANNGRVFSWADPPAETGHPGNDIQCRCVSIPQMDSVETDSRPPPPPTAPPVA